MESRPWAQWRRQFGAGQGQVAVVGTGKNAGKAAIEAGRLRVEEVADDLIALLKRFRLPPLPAAALLRACRQRRTGVPIYDLAPEGALCT